MNKKGNSIDRKNVECYYKKRGGGGKKKAFRATEYTQ